MRQRLRHGVGAAQRSRRDAALVRYQLMSRDVDGLPGKLPSGCCVEGAKQAGHGRRTGSDNLGCREIRRAGKWNYRLAALGPGPRVRWCWQHGQGGQINSSAANAWFPEDIGWSRLGLPHCTLPRLGPRPRLGLGTWAVAWCTLWCGGRCCGGVDQRPASVSAVRRA
jgi:hypothetical protein